MTGNTSIKLTKFSRFLITLFIMGIGYLGFKYLYPYFKDKIPLPTEKPTEQPTVNDTYDVMPEKAVVPVTDTPLENKVEGKAPQYKQPLEQKEVLLKEVKPITPVFKKPSTPKKQPAVVQDVKAVTKQPKGALDLEDDHKREKISAPKGALDLEDDHGKKKKN